MKLPRVNGGEFFPQLSLGGGGGNHGMALSPRKSHITIVSPTDSNTMDITLNLWDKVKLVIPSIIEGPVVEHTVTIEITWCVGHYVKALLLNDSEYGVQKKKPGRLSFLQRGKKLSACVLTCVCVSMWVKAEATENRFSGKS